MDIPGTENSDVDGFEEHNQPSAHGNQPNQEWRGLSIAQQNEVRSMMEALKEIDARMAEEYDDFQLKLTESQLIRSNLNARADLKETELYNSLVALRKMQQTEDDIMKAMFAETKEFHFNKIAKKQSIIDSLDTIKWGYPLVRVNVPPGAAILVSPTEVNVPPPAAADPGAEILPP